ncbi:hypothetical protein ES705_02037 [subsurface metagenome]|nr:hypothetical protein [Clostridia bacterium]
MLEVAQSPTASSKKGDRYIFNETGVSNESLTHNLEFLLKVNVKLFASVRKFSRRDNLEINIEEGSIVKDLLSKIGIPQNEPLLVIVNESTQGKETPLQEGDTLCLFPIIAGG